MITVINNAIQIIVMIDIVKDTKKQSDKFYICVIIARMNAIIPFGKIPIHSNVTVNMAIVTPLTI